MATRQALTAEMIAQIAAGVTPAASAATAAPSVASPAAAAAEGIGGAAPAAAAEGAAAAAAAATTEGTGVAAPAAAAAAPAAAAAAAAPAVDVTAFLQGQIATKDQALLTANVEIAGLKAKLADNDTAITGLLAIAAAATNNMRVALGGSKTDLSALTATQLLAQHESAKAEFEKKFVAGGVAAVDAAQDAKPDAATSLAAQRLNRISA